MRGEEGDGCVGAQLGQGIELDWLHRVVTFLTLQISSTLSKNKYTTITILA